MKSHLDFPLLTFNRMSILSRAPIIYTKHQAKKTQSINQKELSTFFSSNTERPYSEGKKKQKRKQNTKNKKIIVLIHKTFF